jgi:hypothetical protein
MPFPAVLGLPALATLFTGFASSMAAWFLSKITAKVAVILAALTSMAVVTAVFLAAFSALLSNVVSLMSPDVMSGLYFLPTNINHCISLIVGFHTSLIVYDMAMKVIQLKVDIAS